MSREIDTKTSADKQPRSLDPTWLLTLGGLAVTLEGCRLVGDIFRAGVWVGVVGVILFAAMIIGAIRFFTS
jgi:hypothetical protein